VKLEEALKLLVAGHSIELADQFDEEDNIVIRPSDIDEEDTTLDNLVLDITVRQALSDKWKLHYGNEEYKKDMRTLADTLGRLTAAGIQINSNGDQLREIDTVAPEELKLKPGFISNYNGKWTLK
jgi:hypothetical protein